jgi:lipopolysaccharide heptosyltransferase II
MSHPVAIPPRIVLRTPNWLGDAVMALPACAAVRTAFPESYIAIAALPSIAPLFEEETGAAPDEVIVLDVAGDFRLKAEATGSQNQATGSQNQMKAEATGSRDEKPGASRLSRFFSRGFRLQAEEFDAALLFPNSFRSAWTTRRAGIPERWGYGGNFRSWMLTRAVPRPRAKVHQATYYLDLVRGLGIPALDAVPRLALGAVTAGRADALLARHGIEKEATLVGFAPGAAYGHAKRWPPRRVADVIARLGHERGAVAVLVGAADDRDAGREIESSLPSGVAIVNLIGRTDLRQLAGVLARCRAFVSNDSGAMHLAAAVGVPVVAIFGPTDDRVTAPLGGHDVLVHQVFCRPCMLRDCPIDHRCMKGITVDSVVARVTEKLESAVLAEAQERKPGGPGDQ